MMRPGQTVNREMAGVIFGVSVVTIDQWISAGCPAEKGQKQWRINTAEVARWLRDRERKLALSEVSNIDEADARRRKIAAEAALAEHELAVKTGAALSIADWQSTLSGIIANARAKALAFPAKWGPRVAIEPDAAECEALLDEGVREFLLELSADAVPDIATGNSEPENGSKGDSQPVGPATRPNGKRVGRRRKAPKQRKQRRTG